MMKIPQQAKQIVREFEGLSLKAYLCPSGFWTIGYGHRCNAEHLNITAEEAEEYLYEDLKEAQKWMYILCPLMIDESEERQSAIISFVFNLGQVRLRGSTLRDKILKEDWDGVKEQLARWVYSKGKKSNGLIRRRNAEIALI
jgi:lysozyme